jgi:hypothetical protein
MYTSCGWFFDELSGLETVQVMQYVGRVVQLAQETSGANLEPEFLARLEEIKSNIPEPGDGANIYRMWIKPAMVDLEKVGAHYAISSIFDGNHVIPQFCYEIKSLDYNHAESGAAKLALGHVRVTSHITRESRELAFAVIYMGGQALHAGVHNFKDEKTYQKLVEEAMAVFSAGDFAEVVHLLDDHFEGMSYSLKSLFRDEQRRILDIILSRTLHDAEASYHEIYAKHGPLLRLIKEMGQPVPEVLRITAEFVLNRDLKKTFDTEPVDFVRAAMLMEMVKRESVRVDEATVGYSASKALTHLLQRLRQNPLESETLERASVLASLFATLPLPVDYWQAQNIYYSIFNQDYPALARRDDPGSRAWRERFLALGEKLHISVPALTQEVELPMAV